MPCPYCASPDVQKRMVFKDDIVMAFPTNIPITPGHVLVCPVRHVGTIQELSDEELLAIKNLLIRIKGSLEISLGSEGFNVAWNEGAAGGQSINHLHIHVVPRKEGDSGIYDYEPRKFLYRPGSRNESPEQELQEIAQLIKKSL